MILQYKSYLCKRPTSRRFAANIVTVFLIHLSKWPLYNVILVRFLGVCLACSIQHPNLVNLTFITVLSDYNNLRAFSSHAASFISIWTKGLPQNLAFEYFHFSVCGNPRTCFIIILTPWSRSLSKCYLRIQPVPQREHHTSPLQRSTG
jgi:hypothetical protein